MQKVILILLTIYSVTFSNIKYDYKDLNDSTRIVRLSIPNDTNLYTCFDVPKYTEIGSKLKTLNVVNTQYSICQESITRYEKLDSLYISQLDTCKSIYTDLSNEYADTVITLINVRNQLTLQKKDKFLWGGIGTSIGFILGSVLTLLMVIATN